VVNVADWAVQSGRSGKRLKLRRVLSDPDATVIVVDYRDQLARWGVERVEAVLAGHGGRVVIARPGEATDDVVHDRIAVVTSMWAQLCGRRGAGSRVVRASTATTKRESGEAA
jgi:putative resolvase